MSETKWQAWARPNRPDRKDIIGVRDLPDGRQEYLMHNEALCRPYYLAVSAPAESVIEVAPGEQTLENGGLTQDDAWNIVYGVEKTDPVPAVPAQEAPREEIDKQFEGIGEFYAAEPQAGAQVSDEYGCADCNGMDKHHPSCPGAQVPSQDERWTLCPECDRPKSLLSSGPVEYVYVCEFCEMLEENELLEKHLNSIQSYATEAAKTPITREDMHDPLKAQTFFDEAKGFERLVLSEIGGPK